MKHLLKVAECDSCRRPWLYRAVSWCEVCDQWMALEEWSAHQFEAHREPSVSVTAEALAKKTRRLTDWIGRGTLSPA